MMDGNNWFGQIRDADSSPDEEAMFSAKAAYAEAFSRETVFCVYDGTKKIGEGRLASPTETEIYDDGYEVAFRAAFAMQGPTAATRGWTPGSYYLALPGDWNPFPSLIAWNNSKAAFTVDLDAQGHIAKGRIRLGPYSYCEADGTVVFPDREEDDELYPYIDVTYRGETKAYILGAADDMLTVIDGDLTKRVSFCDLDGDGLMEMHVTDVMPGGEIELIVSFQSGAQQIVDISYSE